MSEHAQEPVEPQEPGDEPEPEQETGDEPEQGDEDEQPEQPQPQAPPQPGQTPEALERRARSAETRFATYARAIRGLYEDEAENLLDCPLCPTFHKGMIDARFAGQLPEDVVDAVKFYLGFAREQGYESSTLHQACAQCGGKGKVKTGSTVPGHETISCPDCKGYGYMPPPAATQGNVVKLVPEQAQETNDQVLQSPDDTDEWGEPRILPDGRENPNFGRMPNRKVLVEPYGVTAGMNTANAG